MATRCYFCGGSANGPDDHVPPEALFRGASGRSYKSPEIVAVPACIQHNQGASADDELLAWVMSSGAMGNPAAFDVYQRLSAPVVERMWSDRSFADERLAHGGFRVLRDPKDYDENGAPKDDWLDPAYPERAEGILSDRWRRVKGEIQKIAAGLFFHSQGQSLGSALVGRLEIVVPEFKQVEPEIRLTEVPRIEKDHFARVLRHRNTPGWVRIVSGAPEVFQCDIARHRDAWRFAMRMEFYQSIRAWVTLG